MRILILSFYFSPDLSACSFRVAALVNALSRVLPENAQLDVVTTLPNRYSSFSASAPEIEILPGVYIRRIALPAHQSGVIDQAKAFWSFIRGSLQFIESRDYDLVFATSSRLMTAVFSAYVARKKAAKLYLDIRDIFVDTINDVFPTWFGILVVPLCALMERWTIGQANKVNLVSPGFSDYFATRYPWQSFSFFTNGVDNEFLSPVNSSEKLTGIGSDIITVVYAGNIGEGQGLHLILPILASRLRGRVHFRVIGDGGRKKALLQALADAGVDNVELLPPVGRIQLVEEYQRADVLFLHLNKHEAFKKVLPSKIFEYAALGKPIWAGVAGYAAQFIGTEIDNALVFQPCNADEALARLNELVLTKCQRTDFVRRYSSSSIMQAMVKDVLSV